MGVSLPGVGLVMAETVSRFKLSGLAFGLPFWIPLKKPIGKCFKNMFQKPLRKARKNILRKNMPCRGVSLLAGLLMLPCYPKIQKMSNQVAPGWVKGVAAESRE